MIHLGHVASMIYLVSAAPALAQPMDTKAVIIPVTDMQPDTDNTVQETRPMEMDAPRNSSDAPTPSSRTAAPSGDVKTPMAVSGSQTLSTSVLEHGVTEGMVPMGMTPPIGSASAPALPTDNYADRFFPAARMAQARAQMMREQGGQSLHRILFNLAEFAAHRGRDGYRWDGQGWFGGDVNRLTIKSEGEGTFRQGLDSAEMQALYSRAIGPYYNIQAGIRHDFQPSPSRTYATIGFEGLAPYEFETEGALFLSTKGDLLGRLEGWYDQRLTQRTVLQPRVELNFSAQDVPEDRYGNGLTSAELGLRLRYEIRREFAPYIGVTYDAKTGKTADFARADGERPRSTSFVMGVRAWF